jgi:hypothetical protein
MTVLTAGGCVNDTSPDNRAAAVPIGAPVTPGFDEVTNQTLAGGSHLLSLGMISPARRRIDNARSTATKVAIDISHPQPLVPGDPVILRFSLTPKAPG